MEIVEPIKSKEEIERCYQIAIQHDKEDKRNAISWELILLVGLSTALRCSDIINLKAKDFRYSESIEVRAKKTGKVTTMGIPAEVRKRILQIIRPLKDDDYIFTSRQTGTAVNRNCIYVILKQIAEEAGVKTKVGTHTLRKTFAYHYFKETGDIATLQDILQHDSQADTLRYIGISTESRNSAMANFTAIVPEYLKK